MTPEILAKEKEIYKAQALAAGKPEKMLDRIVEGKMEKFYEEVCLLEQHFIKDPGQTVGQVIASYIGKLGENINVRRFVRFKLGDTGAPGKNRRKPNKRLTLRMLPLPRAFQAMTSKPIFKRILLKLSGEAMAGTQGYGVDPVRAQEIAREIRDVVGKLGVETALVIGGGNIFRGLSPAAKEMDRVAADHMGMLATVINAIALQDALEKDRVPTRVMTAIAMHQVAEPYIRRRAIRHLEKGRVVIFAAGTGNPYFSTDTAAALRATEIRADVIMKATKVDGIYSADPVKVKDATMFAEISYMDMISKDLRVMDSTAISLCRENHLPIIVFNLNVPGNIAE